MYDMLAYDPQDKIIYAAIMMIAVLYVIPVLVTVATKGSILGISHLKKCGKSLWPNVILDGQNAAWNHHPFLFSRALLSLFRGNDSDVKHRRKPAERFLQKKHFATRLEKIVSWTRPFSQAPRSKSRHLWCRRNGPKVESCCWQGLQVEAFYCGDA